MNTFALALTLGAVSAVSTMEFEYMNHLAKFGKNLGDVEEFHTRLAIFSAKDAEYKQINATEKNFTVGHNQFSDWTHEEYGALLGLREAHHQDQTVIFDESSNADSVNWVEAGAVTGVKDQGQCGSCWSFSTTGAMEGAHFIAKGELLSFSEQQLVDCANTLNMGCNGGNPLWAYRYLKSHDAELESVYPYFSGTTMKAGDCQYDSLSKTSVEVTASSSVTASSPDQMRAALTQQPLAVLVEADQTVFQGYTSGVLDSAACGTNLDHAVLAVGYGTDEATGLDYWLVKNSWSTTWGDNGYIKLAANSSDGICGVQMGPSFPSTN